MTTALLRRDTARRPRVAVAAVAAAVVLQAGCAVTSLTTDVGFDPVPVNRIPPAWRGLPREAKQPIDLALLARPGADINVLGPYDLIGVLIEGVVTQPEQVPPAQYPLAVAQNIEVPAIGVPFRLGPDGTVKLPQLEKRIKLSGLTVVEAEERIRKAYVEDEQILKENVALIRLELLQANSDRVVVIRADRPESGPVANTRAIQLVNTNGSAEEVFLRTPQNDVLHALAATGGLPGENALDEVWILRGIENRDARVAELCAATKNTLDLDAPNTLAVASDRITRIPLRVYPGEALPFAPEDVILDEGDIVYVPPRDAEHFVVGGIVQGGRFELPRDEDLDVIDALAIASGVTVGPNGIQLDNGYANVIDPSRVTVIRTLGNGDIVKILVDLHKAHADPKYRLLIQPDDKIILQYTEAEIAANGLSRIMTFGWGFTYFTN